MPQSANELNIPAYPNSEPARSFVIHKVTLLEKDIQIARESPHPARTLVWNEYDQDIRAIVSHYNDHLRHTPGHAPLDWRLIKAMLWTETGPHAYGKV